MGIRYGFAAGDDTGLGMGEKILYNSIFAGNIKNIGVVGYENAEGNDDIIINIADGDIDASDKSDTNTDNMIDNVTQNENTTSPNDTENTAEGGNSGAEATTGNVNANVNGEMPGSEDITVPEGDGAVSAGVRNIYVQMPQSVGQKYSLELLQNGNYIIDKFFTVPSSTKLFSSDLDINAVNSFDMTLKQDNSKPQILIYHTHSQEGFSNSVAGDEKTSIVAVGEYLTKILHEQFGYNVIHCTEKFDYANGKVDRSQAYIRARPVIESILQKYPSIEVVLDVHRDGVDDSLRLVTEVNGKPTAKIMFFNGLCRNSAGNDIDYGANVYRQQNLAMSMRMKLLAEEFYPNFTRRNYVNSFHYNMNLREKSMLIEVGAQTNTLEEAMNAMEPLAVLLSKLLN